MMRHPFPIQVAALSMTALVPVAFVIPAQAQERIAQDPGDDLRAAREALLAKVPQSCVSEVMDEASRACVNSCMITIPNAALPDADSCDARNWVCVWPIQAVNETNACPAGWTGTYNQDRYYEVQNCGQDVVDTGKVNVLSVNCTRDREETRIEACPQDAAGGNWTGGGVTYSRIHYEKLETDLATVTETSVTDWAVKSVDCRRTETRVTHDACGTWILGSMTASCVESSVNGTIVSSNCPTTTFEPRNSSSVTTLVSLNNDLATVSSQITGGPTMTYNTCPPAIEGGGGGGDSGEGGDAGGDDGGGDGDCPLIIDIDSDGVTIVPYAKSYAVFDFKAEASNSTPVKTAWYGPKEGILARDHNGNGAIDNITEVFGGANLDGFTDLANEEDTNKDGKIDKNDDGWSALRIWIDRDSSGVSLPDELYTLDEMGIEVIELSPSKINITYPDAYIPKQGKVKMRDGSEKNSFTVFFTNASAKANGKGK